VIAQNQTAYKLIADTSAEILPGRSLSALLVFPVVVTAPEAHVAFYELTLLCRNQLVNQGCNV
jgi:hypothetical protein